MEATTKETIAKAGGGLPSGAVEALVRVWSGSQQRRRAAGVSVLHFTAANGSLPVRLVARAQVGGRAVSSSATVTEAPSGRDKDAWGAAATKLVDELIEKAAAASAT